MKWKPITVAFSAVPTQIWWNPHEDVVVHQGTTQSAAFVRQLLRLNPDAPVEAVVHGRPHGEVFRSTTSLSRMVDFLLSHRRGGAPDSGFSYVSWLPEAHVWGWAFRSAKPGHGFWRIEHASERGFSSRSAGRLLVTPPGMRTIRLSPGRHSVIFD